MDVNCEECRATLATVYNTPEGVAVEPAEGMVARRHKGLVDVIRPLSPKERYRPGRQWAFTSVRFEHCGVAFALARAGYNGRRFDA